MAEDRWPQWAAEQAGTNQHPSTASTLALFALVVALLLSALSGPDAAAQGGGRGSLCDQHHGRPGWASVCQEDRPGR